MIQTIQTSRLSSNAIDWICTPPRYKIQRTKINMLLFFAALLVGAQAATRAEVRDRRCVICDYVVNSLQNKLSQDILVSVESLLWTKRLGVHVVANKCCCYRQKKKSMSAGV